MQVSTNDYEATTTTENNIYIYISKKQQIILHMMVWKRKLCIEHGYEFGYGLKLTQNMNIFNI